MPTLSFPFIEPLEARIAPATLTVTNLNATGTGSLYDTVQNSADGDQIVFKKNLTGTISLNSQLVVDHDLQIIGNTGSGGGIEIAGGDARRLLEVETGAVVKISHLVMSNGYDQLRGGAIFTSGKLTLADCTISKCAAGEGGAIYEDSGKLTLRGCTIVENSTVNNGTSGYGGAVFVNGGAAIEIAQSKLFNNESYTSGGALFAGADSMVTVTGSAFTDNTAVSFGGAIFDNAGTKLAITGAKFATNSAASGGAVGTVTVEKIVIKGSNFSKNTATQSGGALYNEGTGATSQVLIAESTFFQNSAQSFGGLAVSGNGTAVISHCLIKGNTAASYGGAYFQQDDHLQIISTVIAKNTATTGKGGGLGFVEVDQATVSQCSILKNTSGLNGAGVYADRDLTVTKSVVKANTAANGPGGGFYLAQDTQLKLIDSSVTKNTAVSGGGVYLDTNAVLKRPGSIITGNTGGNVSP